MFPTYGEKTCAVEPELHYFALYNKFAPFKVEHELYDLKMPKISQGVTYCNENA